MAAAAGTTPPPATVTLRIAPFQEYRFETPLLALSP